MNRWHPLSVIFVTFVISLIFSLWPSLSVARGLYDRRYMETAASLRDSTIIIPLDSESDEWVIDARGAMSGIGERPGLSPNYWGISLYLGYDSLTITLRHGNTSFGDILDRRQSIVSLRHGKSVIAERDADGFESSSGKYNTIQVGFDRLGRMLRVSGGGRKVSEVISVPLEIHDSTHCSASLWSKGVLNVSSLSVENRVAPQKVFATSWSRETLDRYFASSSDDIEGYWQYLDRENDPLYARPGGRYVLAIVKAVDSEDIYDILYVSGAETMASEWKPMMLKGRLIRTIFIDHYDLEWIDSTFEPIRRDIHAQISDRAILTLSFPLLKSTMRFSKMPSK